MFKIIICDDDKKQADYLDDYISHIPLCFKFEVHTFYEIKDMLHYCHNNQESNYIFLLDVMFQEKSQGILSAKYINQHFQDAMIIFVSAYLETACDIYDTSHCYFIYKPQFEDRIQVALEKAVSIYNQQHQTIYLDTTEGMNQIYVNEILYIERIKRYSIIHCLNKDYKTHSNLDEIIAMIPSYFAQCHKSIVVNFKHVEKKEKNLFQMKNQIILPISRSYEKIIHHQFQQFIIGV